MYAKQISSISNPLIKDITNLSEKSRDRRRQGLIIVEGRREIRLALESGYILQTLLFAPDIIDPHSLSALTDMIREHYELIEVTNAVYEKIAYREGTEGVVAIFQAKELELSTLKFNKPNPLILIAEAPEKPGNIGALLRTCDAAGVDAVIIANPTTDLYNPNIIRSSVGGLFTNQVVSGSTSEIINYLKANDINIYAAALVDDAISCYDIDYTGPTAIVVGTEATGLSKEWLSAAKANIIIPMGGKLDSLNVSVSAGILIFDAVRQRMVK